MGPDQALRDYKAQLALLDHQEKLRKGENPKPSSPSIMGLDQALRDYKAQLALLDHQQKLRNSENPKPSVESSDVTGRVGYFYVDGSLICSTCLDNMRSADQMLWRDLSEEVHVRVLKDLRQVPHLRQCFCGYSCLNDAGLQAHFAQRPRDVDGFERLMQRVARINLHDHCRAKLLAAVQGTDNK